MCRKNLFLSALILWAWPLSSDTTKKCESGDYGGPGSETCTYTVTSSPSGKAENPSPKGGDVYSCRGDCKCDVELSGLKSTCPGKGLLESSSSCDEPKSFHVSVNFDYNAPKYETLCQGQAITTPWQTACNQGCAKWAPKDQTIFGICCYVSMDPIPGDPPNPYPVQEDPPPQDPSKPCDPGTSAGSGSKACNYKMESTYDESKSRAVSDDGAYKFKCEGPCTCNETLSSKSNCPPKTEYGGPTHCTSPTQKTFNIYYWYNEYTPGATPCKSGKAFLAGQDACTQECSKIGHSNGIVFGECCAPPPMYPVPDENNSTPVKDPYAQ